MINQLYGDANTKESNQPIIEPQLKALVAIMLDSCLALQLTCRDNLKSRPNSNIGVSISLHKNEWYFMLVWSVSRAELVPLLLT